MKTEVGNWIPEENIFPFLETLSTLVAYDFDSDDEWAIRAGVEKADEVRGKWFDYPLIGKGRIDLSITTEHGSGACTVRVETDLDVKGAVDMLFLVCQTYPLREP